MITESTTLAELQSALAGFTSLRVMVARGFVEVSGYGPQGIWIHATGDTLAVAFAEMVFNEEKSRT